MLNFIKARHAAWLKKRLPRAKEVTLTQRRIFIVPSRLGLALVALCVLLFVVGINFQNSLVYGLCFWLMALLVVNILHTYRNLAGLSLRAVQFEPCFAGEKAVLTLEATRPTKQHKYHIYVGWLEQDLTLIDLTEAKTQRVKLSHDTCERGYFYPPRLEVYTRYPTHLAVAWSYVSFNIAGIVYPHPLGYSLPLSGQQSGDTSQQGIGTVGVEDFAGLRSYQAGDSLRRIHWAYYAKSGQLHSKTFVDYPAQELWLDWEQVPFPNPEARLSYLCQQVLDYHQQQRQFGLKLPDTRIAPATGEAHKTQCLTALALYGIVKDSAYD